MFDISSPLDALENEARNIDWDFAYHRGREYWDSLDERINREKTFRRNLKQSGVDGFQSAVDRRNYLWRPGGEVERAAGKFSRPNVMRKGREYSLLQPGEDSPDEEPDEEPEAKKVKTDSIIVPLFVINQKQFSCDECSAIFSSKVDKNAHLQSQHNVIFHYCKDCKKAFSSEDEFNALFQQEYLYNEKVNGKECDDCEDVEFSSCTGGATASCSSCCSEVTSASYDEAVTTAEETVDDFCTSGTRIGQLMRVQARRRANTTCCLDLISKNNATNCLEMKNYDLSWNPIVFEKMASNSAGAGLACSFGAYGRSYSWGASKRNTISRCIHNLYYLYISKLSFWMT